MSSIDPITHIIPAGFFILRCPALPFSSFASLGRVEDRISEDMTDAEWEAVRADARSKLAAIVSDSLVGDALFHASPSLCESLPHWKDNPCSRQGRKVEWSLLKYVSRMAARSTPFGGFAGVAVGKVAGATRLELNPAVPWSTHTRLDNGLIEQLAARFKSDRRLRSTLRFRHNPDMYLAGGRIRFVSQGGRESQNHGELVSFERTQLVDFVLALTNKRQFYEDIVSAVARHESVDLIEARSFVDQLIDDQILETDLGPNVTGPEPLMWLIQKLSEHPSNAEVCKDLTEIHEQLALIDGLSGSKSSELQSVKKRIAKLVSPETARCFQSDLRREGDGLQLAQRVASTIGEAANVVWRLSSRPNKGLSAFVAEFRKRWDGRETPLLEALDVDTGLPFDDGTPFEASELLRGMPPQAKANVQNGWSSRETKLLRLVERARRENTIEVKLDDSDITSLQQSQDTALPAAFSVMASIAARDSDAIDSGDFLIHVHYVNGPSGANLLGRFCHADRRLEENVREYFLDEEALDSSAIFAEVVHLPDARAANVICRPVLRKYEIPCMGISGAPEDRQIRLNDLSVSLDGDRIVLWSRSHGREVRPRLASAHAFSQPKHSKVYRFLAAIQSQTDIFARFGWGVLSESRFLPRITYKNVVLSLARWRLQASDFQCRREGWRDAYRVIQHLRAAEGLPRFVTVVDGDNLLPIDLENPLGIDGFVRLGGSRDETHVQELFPGPDQMPLRTAGGHSVSEVIVPFVERAAGVAVQSFARRRRDVKSARQSADITMNRWVYVKWFSGYTTIDQILRSEIPRLLTALQQRGLYDRWFFVRYDEEGPHLRLRFRATSTANETELLSVLGVVSSELTLRKMLWRTQVDTYCPEIERYGGDIGVDVAEEIFQIDSEMVLRILETLQSLGAANDRWMLAVVSVKMIVEAFGIHGEKRAVLFERLANSLIREMESGVVSVRKVLGTKFRELKPTIDSLTTSSSWPNHHLREAFDDITLSSRGYNLAAARFDEYARSKQVYTDRDDFVASVLHMHLNRLFRSMPRLQEMVVYDILRRVSLEQTKRHHQQVV